jgi:hypothetical protein
MYAAHKRASTLAWAAGLYLAMEVVARVGRFQGMAWGWRGLSWLMIGWGFKSVFNYNNAQTYGPLIGAYLRKYGNHSSADSFEINDRKREFYQIDTRQYMSYTHADLPHGHTNYGPQPDGEAEDASWYMALDKFLAGEENHGLKEHANYLHYPFEYKDKSFPSVEMAGDLINKH